MADYTKSSTLNPLLAATVTIGVAGAVVGATAAATRLLIQAKKGDLKKEQAIKTVLHESAGTGLATASAAAVVGVSGLGGLLGLIGFTGVAVGTKHFWDNFTAKKSMGENAEEKKEEDTSKETKTKKP